VRLDLGLGELARQRLDLALIRGEGELHGAHYSPGRLRTRLAPALLAVALLAGCGGHKPASPESVVRAWSAAINAGENEKAADLFAPGAVVVQSGQLVLRTHADAVAWNAALPCAGHIVQIATDGEQATATFLLGERPGQICDGPGQKATAVFTVHRGKIVLWHQVPNPGAGESGGAPAV